MYERLLSGHNKERRGNGWLKSFVEIEGEDTIGKADLFNASCDGTLAALEIEAYVRAI